MRTIGLLVGAFLMLHCNGEKKMSEHTNRLINETSPYLQQHAHNPVEWFPWGEEAFARARAEDKPILLSIGYSACHWCHVMEKESFENPEIAQLMNRLFVNIKVDREERPDVDQRYMAFVQAFTGSGGWPLTVFLTPEGEPFYGGTYFPPVDRYGKPGLKKLLKVVAEFYRNNPQELQQNLQKIREMLDQHQSEITGSKIPDAEAWRQAVEELTRYYDPEHGGMGQAPKFPAPQVFSLFLRFYAHGKDPLFLEMTEHTLQRMAWGGIYDQLGGGFARYAVDAGWRIPHFEKMLYDNAQLSNLYLDAFLVTKNPFYLRVVRETLQFVRRELSDSLGGFYASLDADSEGEEGKFYLWSWQEILDNLGEENGRLFCARFGVRKEGNFKGRNILFVNKSLQQLAEEFHTSVEEVETRLEQARRTLFNIRDRRVHPGLDYKVLTSWNGLMLSAFARAYQVTGDETYARVVRKNLSFVRNYLFDEGRLLHVYSKGQSKIDAFVDDYAFLIAALLDAYEALFDVQDLQLALELTEKADELFWDHQHGGYFFTAEQERQKYPPLKNETDSALPAPATMMLFNQLRLFHLSGEPRFREKAETLLRKYGERALGNPYAFATYLNALDFYLSQPLEILILKRDAKRFEAFRRLIFERYLPNKVVMVEEGASGLPPGNALLQGRHALQGKTTVFVCQAQTCSLPMTRTDELEQYFLQKKE